MKKKVSKVGKPKMKPEDRRDVSIPVKVTKREFKDIKTLMKTQMDRYPTETIRRLLLNALYPHTGATNLDSSNHGN